MKTNWDYSKLAKAYVNRPDYSIEGLDTLFKAMQGEKGQKVCDIGAGVAHLTIPLLERGFVVDAVEPNDAMRAIGIKRTKQFDDVEWFEGTGENTTRPSNNYDIVTFGSSFNVTDRQKALEETNRLLKSKGWFACMWNHRDLDNDIQNAVEEIIKSHIKGYGYGTRREDQKEVIEASKLFEEVFFIEGSVQHTVTKKDWVDAWRSHATLDRQAGDQFHKIIQKIEQYLETLAGKTITVPYTTRIWFAQKKD